MAMQMTRCPKCANRMEEGFVVDVSQADYRQSQWVQGRPEKSFWTGLTMKGRDRRSIVTYRCVRCGFLESYAGEESKPR